MVINIITYKIPPPILIQRIEGLRELMANPGYEIRVINNGPAEYTEDIEDNFPGIEVVQNGPDTSHLSATWNMAIATSRSPYVMILSDDVELHMSQEIDKDFFSQVENRLMNGYDYIIPSFSCFIVDKIKHDEMGGFDEKFKGGGFEDNDYLLRIIANGYDVSFKWGAWENNPIPKLFSHWHGDDKAKYAQLKRAWPADKQAMNRQYFNSKYGDERAFYRMLDAVVQKRDYTRSKDIPGHLRGMLK